MPETTTTHEWIERVLAEHRQLNAMVDEIRRFLEAPRPAVRAPGAHTWSTRLVQRLVPLHDALYRHFREEEDGGMVEELSRRHPRAIGAVDSLLEDHVEILGGLRRCTQSVLEYSDGVEPDDPALRRRILAILDCLHRHEAEETDLIQRLEYEMLGSGD